MESLVSMLAPEVTRLATWVLAFSTVRPVAELPAASARASYDHRVSPSGTARPRATSRASAVRPAETRSQRAAVLCRQSKPTSCGLDDMSMKASGCTCMNADS